MKAIFSVILLFLLIGCQQPAVIPEPVNNAPVAAQNVADGEVVPESIEPVVPAPQVAVPTPQVFVIKVERRTFSPNTLRIVQDSTVRWESVDESRDHLIIHDKGGYIKSGIRYKLGPLESIEYQFQTPGSYEILDANFGSRLQIVVEPLQ